ncbi:MAG: DUF1145 domain-containing protein [Myxococcota bacterium]|jgi:uncharacterized protein YhhL (DUF1145 family)
MSETNEPSGVYPIGKAVLGAVWLFATACFLPPLNGAEIGALGRSFFGVLAVTHIVECLFFLGTLRKTGRPLVGELWQTFLFGIVHVSAIRAESKD